MMNRQSTRHAEHAEPLDKHAEACTRCTESIRRLNKEEIRVVAVVWDSCVNKEVE
jgi:hypothetical protein